jgi:hypothetical protein
LKLFNQQTKQLGDILTALQTDRSERIAGANTHRIRVDDPAAPAMAFGVVVVDVLMLLCCCR